MRVIATLLMLLLWVDPAFAQSEPVLDLGNLPRMRAGGLVTYRDQFLLGNLPRVWAIGSDGSYGGAWGAASPDAARAKALQNCANRGARDCSIYAADLDVVWQGRETLVRTVPGPLISARFHAFVPDDRYFWRGPAVARGVLVWAHGTNGNYQESRGGQPHPFVRVFNNAGFDVVRFDRDPIADRTEAAAEWLHKGLAELRAQGWKSVIVAGQSRGAWNGLQVLDTPGLADAVIAMSPAAHGDSSATGLTLIGETDLWRVTEAARAPQTRVVIAQFRGDPFYASGDNRAALFERLRPRVGALLIIDRPDGFEGHAGANSAAFAEKYGTCIFHFATDPMPPAGC
jgi:hypothetical protein